MIGRCPAMQEVYKAIGRVADQNINVLIRGESGTGKELVARAIHRHSCGPERSSWPSTVPQFPSRFWKANSLVTKKGAFTGAVSQRIGKFEECDGGTLFLDEVGDMPLLMQSKVLRAIQEKEFQRVAETRPSRRTFGSSRPRIAISMPWQPQENSVPTWVIASTVTASSCPLCAIGAPTSRFWWTTILECSMPNSARRFPASRRKRWNYLKQYSWPGNIRELQTVLKHAMLHAIGPILVPEFLPPELRGATQTMPAAGPASRSGRR